MIIDVFRACILKSFKACKEYQIKTHFEKRKYVIKHCQSFRLVLFRVIFSPFFLLMVTLISLCQNRCIHEKSVSLGLKSWLIKHGTDIITTNYQICFILLNLVFILFFFILLNLVFHFIFLLLKNQLCCPLHFIFHFIQRFWSFSKIISQFAQHPTKSLAKHGISCWITSIQVLVNLCAAKAIIWQANVKFLTHLTQSSSHFFAQSVQRMDSSLFSPKQLLIIVQVYLHLSYSRILCSMYGLGNFFIIMVEEVFTLR